MLRRSVTQKHHQLPVAETVRVLGTIIATFCFFAFMYMVFAQPQLMLGWID